MENRIQVLDCTLRDGGLGLEDADKNGVSSQHFLEEQRIEIAKNLTSSKIDIIELGSVEITKDDRKGFCIYQSIEDLSRAMPPHKHNKQMFAALYRGPDTSLDKIPDWNPSLCEAVRVIIRYSELKKSLDFCSALSSKGYKVFVQPMLTMRYSNKEIDYLISEANRMNAYALYFVDSYGYMENKDVLRLFKKIDKELLPDIRIGFHSHNNMNLAFSNVLYYMGIKTNRNIIIDSCLTGMGQGAGNLQTELILGYLNRYCGFNYNYDSVLEACEIIEKLNTINMWGYSVTTMLPALHKCAYKYSIVLRKCYGLSYKQIDHFLAVIPKELKQRYTKESLELVLKRIK